MNLSEKVIEWRFYQGWDTRKPLVSDIRDSEIAADEINSKILSPGTGRIAVVLEDNDQYDDLCSTASRAMHETFRVSEIVQNREGQVTLWFNDSVVSVEEALAELARFSY